MKTLILYMTKHGTTEKVAKMLKAELNEPDTKLVNLRKEKVSDLDNYNTVIIGGSIHAGMLQKRLKKFCEENIEVLKTKRIGLFLCCMDTERFQEQFDNAFPKELKKHSVCNSYFGGEFLFDKMNFLEKAIVKKVAGENESVSKINAGAIKEFAEKIKGFK